MVTLLSQTGKRRHQWPVSPGARRQTQWILEPMDRSTWGLHAGVPRLLLASRMMQRAVSDLKPEIPKTQPAWTTLSPARPAITAPQGAPPAGLGLRTHTPLNIHHAAPHACRRRTASRGHRRAQPTSADGAGRPLLTPPHATPLNHRRGFK